MNLWLSKLGKTPPVTLRTPAETARFELESFFPHIPFDLYEQPHMGDAYQIVPGDDSSFSITGGNREMIPYLMRAALAVGIDGLFIETHPDPDKAISDAANQVRLSDMENLLKQALEINSITR